MGRCLGSLFGVASSACCMCMHACVHACVPERARARHLPPPPQMAMQPAQLAQLVNAAKHSSPENARKPGIEPVKPAWSNLGKLLGGPHHAGLGQRPAAACVTAIVGPLPLQRDQRDQPINVHHRTALTYYCMTGSRARLRILRTLMDLSCWLLPLTGPENCITALTRSDRAHASIRTLMDLSSWLRFARMRITCTGHCGLCG